MDDAGGFSGADTCEEEDERELLDGLLGMNYDSMKYEARVMKMNRVFSTPSK